MYIKNLAVFVHLIIGALSACSYRKIVGGTAVQIEKYSYLAYLRVRFNNGTAKATASCGATILDATTLITAGHCVVDPEFKVKLFEGTARVGSTEKMSGGQLIPIADGYVHPLYEMHTLRNDIGIIKLQYPIQFTTGALPISLGQRLPPVGAMMDIVGWGAHYHEGPTMQTLYATQIPMFSKSKCRIMYASFGFPIPEKTFCAGFLNKKQDTCEGDSGGPIVYNKHLMGIVSWGDGCAKTGRVGIYTDVTKYLRWIQQFLTGK